MCWTLVWNPKDGPTDFGEAMHVQRRGQFVPFSPYYKHLLSPVMVEKHKMKKKKKLYQIIVRHYLWNPC